MVSIKLNFEQPCDFSRKNLLALPHTKVELTFDKEFSVTSYPRIEGKFLRVGKMQMIDSGDCTPEAALLYLEAAIRIMDSCSAPPDIAAHADLAKARLEEWVVSGNMAGVASRVFEGAARQGLAGH